MKTEDILIFGPDKFDEFYEYYGGDEFPDGTVFAIEAKLIQHDTLKDAIASEWGTIAEGYVYTFNTDAEYAAAVSVLLPTISRDVMWAANSKRRAVIVIP